MNKAFYCTPIDGKLGLEKFDVAQWIQTSAYTLRIVNNIAETNFFLNWNEKTLPRNNSDMERKNL